MYSIRWKQILFNCSLVLVGLISMFLFGSGSAASAQNRPDFVREARVIEVDETDVSNPAGLAFSARARTFHVVAGRGRNQPTPDNLDAVKLDFFGNRAGSATISAAIKDPINIAFDDRRNRLLIFQSPDSHPVEVQEGPDGDLDPSTPVRQDADHFGLQDMVVDPVTVMVSTDAAVLVGAGDISICSNDYDLETSLLLDDIDGTVFTLGDNVYPNGTDAEFSDCYDPTWGRHKARTRPATGNHDYNTPAAAGYFNYFGSAAGDPDKGYYSYDVGDWHIIVLNTSCPEVGGCESDSAQGQWLQADLAANQTDCTLAYWHYPRFSSGVRYHGGSTRPQDFWQILYDAGADVVLNGHEHLYERFAPQDPNGVADPERGIREFIVGTGGKSLYPFGAPEPNSEVRENNTYGVLKLTLHPTAYDWEFVPIAGQTFTDSGSASCVGASHPNPAPTVTISAPTVGASFDQGEIVIFTASASDPEDGDVTASLVWVSDLDGTIGTGGTFARTDLTVGLHTITTTATDSDNLSGQAQIALTVNGIDKVSVLEVRVSAGEDDAEEQSNGSVDLKSSDLEFVYDHSDQTVGMRFNGVTLPQGAHIANAYIRFERDETHSGATSLTIHGEAADNAESFISASGNISSRPKTSAAASWEPLPWTTVGEAQRTTNIAHVIEEIINRPGWTSGNSLVLIVTGSGERVAKSYNGEAAAAPLLHIENQTPTVTISAPANNASFDQGASISFSASASDPEDGDVTASLVWVSDLDGTIGAGETFARADLSVGMHIITATASDSGALNGQAQIALTVNVPNSSPTATISAPANNASFDQGASISFSASASDPEDGDITASLVWVSDLDGTIGAGGVFTRTDLTVGMHTITATAIDSGALSSQAQIALTVNVINSVPTVIISAPTDGASFDQGESVIFTGGASDPEDGDITASLVWVSDLDGKIGMGGSFARSDLSVGTHTITATATDSGALSGQAHISLTINVINSAPTVTISAPTDGASFGQEKSIAFTGGANDPEDGDITASLVWMSDLDGKIGMGGSLARSNLSVGTHTITATATDSGNLSGQAHVSLTIDHQPNYLFLPVVAR